MSVKRLIMEAAKMCGSAYPEKRSEYNEIAWIHEMNKKGFQRVKGETARQRVEFLFDWHCENEKKREYCINLATLNALAHYSAEHGDAEAGIEADELTKRLEVEEALYPDVAQVLSVQTASRGWWGD